MREGKPRQERALGGDEWEEWYRERDIEGANKRVNKVLHFDIK